MDLLDGSFDPAFVKWVKTTETALAEAQKKKGQLVTDHPDKDTVISTFMIRALGKAMITPGLSPAGNFIRMACGTDYPFPNSKLVEEHMMVPPIATVEAPYPHPAPPPRRTSSPSASPTCGSKLTIGDQRFSFTRCRLPTVMRLSCSSLRIRLVELSCSSCITSPWRKRYPAT